MLRKKLRRLVKAIMAAFRRDAAKKVPRYGTSKYTDGELTLIQEFMQNVM